MAYQIRIAPAAERAIARLSRALQVAVLQKIAELAEDPRPRGCRRIRGVPPAYEVYRIRLGDAHRIVYQVRDRLAWILVVKVADRKDVYRRMDDLKRSLE